MYDSTGGQISEKLSLIGAPCDLKPAVSERELKSFYKG
jgi:hypothetical protein